MNITTLVYAAVVWLFAGAIRGYSGFGSGMVAVLALTLVLAPARIIPAVLIMEVLASAFLLPEIWRQVDWNSLGFLLLGAAVGTPLGTSLLAQVPADYLRMGIALLALGLSLIFIRDAAPRWNPNVPGRLGVGALSGILNGAAAIGGPPVILFYYGSSRAVAVSRASLIAYFLVIDIYAAGVSMAHGLVDGRTWLFVLAMIIPLGVGLKIGQRLFRILQPPSFGAGFCN